MKLLAFMLAACFATTACAFAMTTDAASILALINASPQLTIDTSVPPIAGTNIATQPYVRISGADGVAGGQIDPDFASIGMLADFTRVMTVPLESGGSGGTFVLLVFAQGSADAKPYYAGYIDSAGHLGADVTSGGIIAVSPDYQAHDPNCCPSRYSIRTYAIVNHALHLTAQHDVSKL